MRELANVSDAAVAVPDEDSDPVATAVSPDSVMDELLVAEKVADNPSFDNDLDFVAEIDADKSDVQERDEEAVCTVALISNDEDLLGLAVPPLAVIEKDTSVDVEVVLDAESVSE